MQAQDLILKESRYTVKETTDKIASFLQQKGITLYARIDQQSEVAKKGIAISPLEFLLFGNPLKGGTIMAYNPLTAIDLPLKAIIWQDDHGIAWVAFNDIAFIKNRFGLSAELARLADIGPLLQIALK